MKFLILFFFLITSACGVSPKKVYMCGDRACIDKKEANNYFKKNLSLEIKIENKKYKKDLDLVKLNKNDENNKINDGELPEDIIVGPIIKSIQDKFFNKVDTKKSVIKDDKINKKLLEKKIKNERKEAKIIEKRNKKISKVKKKLTKINQNIITDDNVKRIKKSISSQNNSICKNIINCDIDKISEMLIKNGNNKEYPNIATK